MRFLLDTHVVLWWLSDSPLLPQSARKLISDPAHTVFVSAVSLWEIRLKESLGKLRVPSDFDQCLGRESFEELPVTAAQTRHLVLLPWHHRDPFDRMLVAQAKEENLVLVTADEQVAAYGDCVQLVR